MIDWSGKESAHKTPRGKRHPAPEARSLISSRTSLRRRAQVAERQRHAEARRPEVQLDAQALVFERKGDLRRDRHVAVDEPSLSCTDLNSRSTANIVEHSIGPDRVPG